MLGIVISIFAFSPIEDPTTLFNPKTFDRNNHYGTVIIMGSEIRMLFSSGGFSGFPRWLSNEYPKCPLRVEMLADRWAFDFLSLKFFASVSYLCIGQ